MINEIPGWVGSFFYGICFLPQIYSIFKNQSPKLDINFIFLQFLGACFMFIYGLINKLYPIMILNAFAWFCIVLILIGYHHNKKNNYTQS